MNKEVNRMKAGFWIFIAFMAVTGVSYATFGDALPWIGYNSSGSRAAVLGWDSTNSVSYLEIDQVRPRGAGTVEISDNDGTDLGGLHVERLSWLSGEGTAGKTFTLSTTMEDTNFGLLFGPSSSVTASDVEPYSTTTVRVTLTANVSSDVSQTAVVAQY